MKNLFKNLFKNVSIILFKLIYGSVFLKKKIDISKVYNEISIKFENCKNYYKIFILKDSRLYTDRIQDTALIYKNLLIDGPSFQLRNNVNSNIKRNIVLEKGTPRILKKINGEVLSLLTGGGGNENYFHWFFDVLPRIAIFEKKFNLKKIDYLLCPNLNEWQLKSLILLGFKKEQLLSSIKFRHIYSPKIYLTNHPWNFNSNILRDFENIPSWISTWLKSKYLKFKSSKRHPKKIYIDRSDSKSNLKNFRSIINEQEVIDFLKKKKFSIVQLSKLKLEDQIKMFYDAKAIIGLHGAGLTNLVWSKEKTNLLELKSKYTINLYKNLAEHNKLNYFSIESKPIGHRIADHYGAIHIDIKKLEKLNL